PFPPRRSSDLLVDLLARGIRRRRLQQREFRQFEFAVAEIERGLRLAGGAGAGLRLLDAARDAALVGLFRGRQARQIALVFVLFLVFVVIAEAGRLDVLVIRLDGAALQHRFAVAQHRLVVLVVIAGEQRPDARPEAADHFRRLLAGAGHGLAAAIEALRRDAGGRRRP